MPKIKFNTRTKKYETERAMRKRHAPQKSRIQLKEFTFEISNPVTNSYINGEGVAITNTIIKKEIVTVKARNLSEAKSKLKTKNKYKVIS